MASSGSRTHHYHFDEITISIRSHMSVADRFDRVEAMLKQIVNQGTNIMATLQDIIAKVEAEKTVEDSAIALLQSISQQLKDAIASNDPTQLQQIADMLDANTSTLTQAVTDNTPAA